MKTPLKLLLVAANVDGTDVGEARCAFEWVHHLGKIAQVTLLTQQRSGRQDTQLQLPHVEVITFPEFTLPKKLERITAMLKPGYPLFAARVRGWVAEARKQGRHFDIAHQLTPVALRYASPLKDCGIPYVLGPHAGSLDTPAGFEAECGSAPLFTHLRKLDNWRFAHDPWLRQSYAKAECVLGVAPYVARILQGIPLKGFEVISELGIESLAPARKPRDPSAPLRLLHVGRAVRTKGLRDCVRVMALLKDLPNVTLDQAGQGEELEICRREAERLGVADRIRFHGQLPRAEIEKLYDKSDIFLFPSFREPSGSVIFEALRHGLCIVTADRGGPGHVIDETCGLKADPVTPETYAQALADHVRKLADDPAELSALSKGARAKAENLGLWPGKLQRLMAIYQKILAEEKRAAA
jgi:glycosyltransferase involved in cell wall biosynthesis